MNPFQIGNDKASYFSFWPEYWEINEQYRTFVAQLKE